VVRSEKRGSWAKLRDSSGPPDSWKAGKHGNRSISPGTSILRFPTACSIRQSALLWHGAKPQTARPCGILKTLSTAMRQRSPLPRICIALGLPDSETLLAHAREEADSGERFFEFRLDYLSRPEQGVCAIRNFPERTPGGIPAGDLSAAPEPGPFQRQREEQFRLLDAAVEAGARAVDVEIESAESAAPRLDAFRGRALVVLSYHNFEGTPAVETVLRRMMRIPADAYKLVTTARKPSDNWRVLALAKAHSRDNVVVLAMGEMGLPTRVLSPAFAGFSLTRRRTRWKAPLRGRSARRYCAVCTASRSSPGRPGSTAWWPIPCTTRFARRAQSRFPGASHRRRVPSAAHAARAVKGPDGNRGQAPGSPASASPFRTSSGSMRYLAVVEPLARRIGAVNTVWRKAGKWRGTNTTRPA